MALVEKAAVAGIEVLGCFQFATEIYFETTGFDQRQDSSFVEAAGLVADLAVGDSKLKVAAILALVPYCSVRY